MRHTHVSESRGHLSSNISQYSLPYLVSVNQVHGGQVLEFRSRQVTKVRGGTRATQVGDLVHVNPAEIP